MVENLREKHTYYKLSIASIILIIVCITLNAFLSIGQEQLYYNTVNEPINHAGYVSMVERSETSYFSAGISDNNSITSKVSDLLEKIGSGFSFHFALDSDYLPFTLITILIIIYLSLLIFLPDGITLINSKIRLND